MKLRLSEVRFTRDAPGLEAICSRIEEICSLPVVILESESDQLHELRALIAFECAQDAPIDIIEAKETEPVGFRKFIVRTLESQDQTLAITTQLALERLGGACQREIADDDRQKYDRRLGEAELLRRLESSRKRRNKIGRARLLRLPLLIPIWFVGGFLFLIALPLQLWLRFEAPAWLRRRDRSGSE